LRTVIERVLPMNENRREAYHEVAQLPHSVVDVVEFKPHTGDVLAIPLMLAQGVGIGIALWNVYMMIFAREMYGGAANFVTGPLAWLFVGAFAYLGAWKFDEMLRR
tara:strand:- start:1846 stop:2163 length:318 start_codon:yes stop_codon:yes gene_type:complete